MKENKTKIMNQNPYERSIGELDLSLRPREIFENEGIENVGQLLEKSEGELLKLSYFGRKSLHEVKEVLSEQGYSLRGRERVQNLREYRNRIECILARRPEIIFEGGKEYGLFGQHPTFYFQDSAEIVKEKIVGSDQLEDRLEGSIFSMIFNDLSNPVSETYLREGGLSYRLQFADESDLIQARRITIGSGKKVRYKLASKSHKLRGEVLLEKPVQSSIMFDERIPVDKYGTVKDLLEKAKPYQRLVKEIYKRIVNEEDLVKAEWALRDGELFMHRLEFLNLIVESNLPLIYHANVKRATRNNLAGYAIQRETK